jgi:ABC-2 type transport system permease protein
MNESPNLMIQPEHRFGTTGFSTPVWWLVCKQELIDLWLRGRALIILLLYVMVLSFSSMMLYWESQFASIPSREIMFITLKSVISFGLFIGLIIGADAISGERERATLESLLLTPASRRQMMLGKFLAALSPWPIAMILGAPYLIWMSQGHSGLGNTLLIGGIMGTLLTIGFTAFGMLVSSGSGSNRNSLFLSLLVYLLFLVPTLWPGTAQKGDLGYFLQQVNPIQGTSQFLAKVLVNNRTLIEQMPYAMATIISAICVPALLILIAAPKLQIDGGRPHLIKPVQRAGVAIVAVILFSLIAVTFASPIQARETTSFTNGDDSGLNIEVDLEHAVTETGDTVEFNTIVTNNGSQPSSQFSVSMNIIKIGSGDPVDPEDWSPVRSQEADALAAGAVSEMQWVIDTILSGNYMVYMTVIPIPSRPDVTTQTISSKGIHFTVKDVPRTNPGGVLPVAVGIPALLVLITIFVRRRWSQGTSWAL